MANYSVKKINEYLADCNDANATHQVRGTSFEDLVSYLFEKMPGVSITERDEMNVFANEEIDVAIWNDREKNGLYFLPNIVLVECKNWSVPVSSIEVAWFAHKLQSRGLDFGILVANNGITGNAAELTASHNIIAQHLAMKRQIIVVTTAEIKQFTKTEQFIELIKKKICKLAVSGRIN